VKFSSAALALEWAETILSIREGGRSNAAALEQLSNGGVGKDYAVLDAVEIRHAAKMACIGGWPCPYIRHKCMFHWHLPDPLVEYPPMPWAQECRIIDCSARFSDLLRKKGFLE